MFFRCLICKLKKHFFASVLFAIILLPSCLFLTACNDKSEQVVGFSVYISEQEYSSTNNSIELLYGDLDLYNKFVIKLNYADESQKTIEDVLNNTDFSFILKQDNNTITTTNLDSGNYVLSIKYKDYDSIDINIKINKKPVDLSGVKFNYSKPYIYNGQAQGPSIVLPKEIVLNTTGDNLSQTDAGQYTTYYNFSLKDDYTRNYEIKLDSTELLQLDWSIEKKKIDMSSVQWEQSDSFVYNTNEQIISLSNLPEEITAVYTNNQQVNAGEYTAIVVIHYDEKNIQLINLSEELFHFELNKYQSLKPWNITKANQIINNFILENKIYDGNPYTLPNNISTTDGTSVSYQYKLSNQDDSQYSDTAPTEIGTYLCKATVNESDNYRNKESVQLFEIRKGNISITQPLNGKIEIEDNLTNAKYLDEVSLIITPNTGYKIVNGSLKINGNPFEGNSFSMPSEDITITAAFEQIDYSIDISDEHGTIYIIDNKLNAYYGETITIIIVRNSKGYTYTSSSCKINNIRHDNPEYTKNNYTINEITYAYCYEYSFVMPAENVNITATFVPNNNTSYNVQYFYRNIDNEEFTLDHTINKSGTTDTNAIIAPNEILGFTFDSINENNILEGIISGTEPLVLKLYYNRNTCIISLDSMLYGSATLNKSTIKAGETITITPIPNNDYEFYRVVIKSGSKTSYSTTTTFTVYEDSSVCVEFILIEKNIYLPSLSKGTISTIVGGIGESTKARPGSSIIIKPTITAGYTISRLGYNLGNSNSWQNTTTDLSDFWDGFSFTMPKDDITIIVEIKNCTYKINNYSAIGGTITANVSQASVNTLITLSIVPKVGYVFKTNTLMYNNTKISGTTFIMPSDNVCLYGQFEKIVNEVETIPQLIIPENVKVIDKTISWDIVENASGYELTIGESIINLSQDISSYDLSTYNEENKCYNIQIKACSDSEAFLDSEVIEYNYYTKSLSFIFHSFQNTLLLSTINCNYSSKMDGQNATSEIIYIDKYSSNPYLYEKATSTIKIYDNGVFYYNNSGPQYSHYMPSNKAISIDLDNNVSLDNIINSQYTFEDDYHVFRTTKNNIKYVIKIKCEGNYASFISILAKSTSNTFLYSHSESYIVSNVVKKDIDYSLYPMVYSVYYQDDEGSIVSYGRKNRIDLLPSMGTKAGYVYKWYTDEYYTNPLTLPYIITEDTTIYGRYEIKKITVSYKIYMSKSSSYYMIYTNQIDYNTPPKYDSSCFVPEGFTNPNSNISKTVISAWYTTSDFSNKQTSDYGLTEDTTYYAYLKNTDVFVNYFISENIYRTSKIENGGISVNNGNISSIQTLAESLTLGDRYIDDISGYIIINWADKDGNIYTADTILTDFETNLYLTYELVKYQISFMTVSETYIGEINDITNVTLNQYITLPDIEDSEGYIFQGWTAYNKLLNKSESLAKSITITRRCIDSYSTDNYFLFYPLWTKTTQLIDWSFDLQGGDYSSPTDVYVVQNATRPAPTPTKSGYEFMGWFTEPNGNGVTASESTQTTVYAYWLQNWETQPFTEITEIDNTYTINSVGDLLWVANKTNGSNGLELSFFANKTVLLNVDIDLSGYCWKPMRSFQGVFDGQNHVINGLTLSSPCFYNDCHSGFFNQISNSIVKNLYFENVRIINNISTSYCYHGVLVNQAYTSTIENIKMLSGEINNSSGIVGRLISSTINNCCNNVDIKNGCGIVYYMKSSTVSNCYNSGSVINKEVIYTGGIAGFVDTSSTNIIKNCYNSGDIFVYRNGIRYVGGILGYSSTNLILNCFNVGNITCYKTIYGIMNNYTEKYVGEIVGKTKDNCTINVENVYNIGNLSKDIDSSTNNTLSGFTNYYYYFSLKNTLYTNMEELNLSDFKDLSFYQNSNNWSDGSTTSTTDCDWDFDGVWQILDNQLPTLR